MKKGLESVHRWKKELAAQEREIASLEKKLASMNSDSPSWEIAMKEKQLANAQQEHSLTEKNLVHSWIEDE